MIRVFIDRLTLLHAHLWPQMIQVRWIENHNILQQLHLR